MKEGEEGGEGVRGRGEREHLNHLINWIKLFNSFISITLFTTHLLQNSTHSFNQLLFILMRLPFDPSSLLPVELLLPLSQSPLSLPLQCAVHAVYLQKPTRLFGDCEFFDGWLGFPLERPQLLGGQLPLCLRIERIWRLSHQRREWSTTRLRHRGQGIRPMIPLLEQTRLGWKFRIWIHFQFKSETVPKSQIEAIYTIQKLLKRRGCGK